MTIKANLRYLIAIVAIMAMSSFALVVLRERGPTHRAARTHRYHRADGPA